jgi:hypothetical protein
VLLHFQTAHVPRPNVYCTAVWSGWYGPVGLRWDSGRGLGTALGPGLRAVVSQNRWCRAPRLFDTTSGDVDVSLATFAVLRLSPQAEGHQDT